MDLLANTSLQLHLGMNSHPEVMKRRSPTHSCLSMVKPHMLQRVLSRECHSNSQHSRQENYNEGFEGSELSGGCKSKIMELFPQHPGFASIPIQPKFNASPNTFNEEDEIKAPAAATHLRSFSQLTIFYNGTINVYDVSPDKEDSMMILAEGFNSNISKRKNGTSTAGGTDGANQNDRLETPHAELPLAKKLCLQRFLQKRKDRLNKSLLAYTRSSK